MGSVCLKTLGTFENSLFENSQYYHNIKPRNYGQFIPIDNKVQYIKYQGRNLWQLIAIDIASYSWFNWMNLYE